MDPDGPRALEQWVMDQAWGHHCSCTCKIGGDGVASAVLDSNFRVRGVDNLRVVDASVFPRMPGYFIVLPIYMVSEKAADVIVASAAAIPDRRGLVTGSRRGADRATPGSGATAFPSSL